jgi:hypothetical protein
MQARTREQDSTASWCSADKHAGVDVNRSAASVLCFVGVGAARFRALSASCNLSTQLHGILLISVA